MWCLLFGPDLVGGLLLLRDLGELLGQGHDVLLQLGDLRRRLVDLHLPRRAKFKEDPGRLQVEGEMLL